MARYPDHQEHGWPVTVTARGRPGEGTRGPFRGSTAGRGAGGRPPRAGRGVRPRGHGVVGDLAAGPSCSPTGARSIPTCRSTRPSAPWRARSPTRSATATARSAAWSAPPDPCWRASWSLPSTPTRTGSWSMPGRLSRWRGWMPGRPPCTRWSRPPSRYAWTPVPVWGRWSWWWAWGRSASWSPPCWPGPGRSSSARSRCRRGGRPPTPSGCGRWRPTMSPTPCPKRPEGGEPTCVVEASGNPQGLCFVPGAAGARGDRAGLLLVRHHAGRSPSGRRVSPPAAGHPQHPGLQHPSLPRASRWDRGRRAEAGLAAHTRAAGRRPLHPWVPVRRGRRGLRPHGPEGERPDPRRPAVPMRTPVDSRRSDAERRVRGGIQRHRPGPPSDAHARAGGRAPRPRLPLRCGGGPRRAGRARHGV